MTTTGKRSLPTLLAAALLVAWPAALAAQQPTAEQQQAMAELQQIQTRLANAQQQAFAQNPDLEQKQDAVNDLVEKTMLEMHPELKPSLDRLEQMQGEFRTAQQAQDVPAMQQLAAEAQQIQQSLQQAQAHALEQPEVAREVEAFRTELLGEMQKVDPETPQLISRLEELAKLFQ